MKQGVVLAVSVEVACEADPLAEESRVVERIDGGSWSGLGGADFSSLPALLSCIWTAFFKAFGALVDCSSPSTPVFCCRYPCIRVDIEGLEGCLNAVFKRFPRSLPERLKTYSSPNKFLWEFVVWPSKFMTSPVRSFDCMSIVLMLGRPARVRTLVSVILSCHLMVSSFLKLVMWKWLSFFFF